MYQSKPVFHLVSVIFLSLSFCLSAEAQTNSIVNPGFDSDLSGWTKAFGRPGEWSPEDAMGNMNSGSALLGNVGVSDGITPFVLVQCFQLQGAKQVEWGGDVLVPNGQPNGTTAYVYLETFNNPTCSGSFLTFDLVGTALAGDWISTSGAITTHQNTLSVRVALGVFKPNGESADAEAFYDNIFLYLPEENSDFVINPSMSASWFDPAQDGHGIMIHLLDATTAWMCWFTFDNAGDPVWICSLGTIVGDTIFFNSAFTLEGGAFPPNFDPGQIVNVPWGTITVVFTGCNEGSMSWTTTAPGFQSGSMPLVRLTPLWGADCN